MLLKEQKKTKNNSSWGVKTKEITNKTTMSMMLRALSREIKYKKKFNGNKLWLQVFSKLF